MTCVHCGTEIAEKALICYKCGRSTTDERAAASAKTAVRRASVWPSALALIVLLCAALYMAYAQSGAMPAWVRWAVAGLAALALAVRIIRRRTGK